MRKTGRNGKSKFFPKLGIVEWFKPGDYDRVREALDDLKEIGVKDLRTGISRHDWQTPENREWVDWLIPQMHKTAHIFPFFSFSSFNPGHKIHASSFPDIETYPEFVASLIDRYSGYFKWVELGWPPNSFEYASANPDSFSRISDAVAQGARYARSQGKKTILGGIDSAHPAILGMLSGAGKLNDFDAAGLCRYPYYQDGQWNGWQQRIGEIERLLQKNQSNLKLWITEACRSTWPYDEVKQWREFVNTMNARVERVFWLRLYDDDREDRETPAQDVRENHFGLKNANGKEKLLYKLLKNNRLDGIDDHPYINYEFPAIIKEKYSLVAGGAGFIGANISKRLLSSGQRVMIFDNLDRPGVERNLQWLYDHYHGNLKIQIADVRDERRVNEAVKHADQVFNFSAQVAVTTSLQDPVYDCDVNIRGALNLLEAIRKFNPQAPLIFTSTNKVYGNLANLEFIPNGSRYNPVDHSIGLYGINEERPLDFHSPYGCSKGAADQYVIDYARSYSLNTAVFRMSCIYGPRQFGTEDQGWVAHFVMSILENKPITIYGDGKQVRDILYVEDLVDAFLLAMKNIDRIAGSAFNIGGGPGNTVSLLEILSMIRTLMQKEIKVRFEDWRTGDQLYYVSDIRKFSKETGWTPRYGVAQGIGKLARWIGDARAALFPKVKNELTV